MTTADTTTASSGRLHDATDTARATATEAAARATETIDSNPLGVLAGGLALGAIAGALLPRTDREKDLLRPVGAKLGATAAAAIAAAKEAGRTEMEQRGLTANSAREQAKSLFDNVVKAASGAATAGARTAKQEATGTSDTPDSTGGTGDYVAPADPHRQVMAADGDVSGFNAGI
ncbi:MAG TPA: hypothetical protein VF592_09755 [Sphingomonas sp.]|jgi:hypothetical protein|uniref:hypothetical protein n=1 Tax=Sphingomonas sp. TaxID=28214 RepID=UPI002EDB33DE